MSDRSVARRYAAALFDVSKKNGRPDQAGDDLSALVQLIDGHAELKNVFETPAVPASAKKEIIASLIRAAGNVSDEVQRLATMLAERDRLMLLPEVQAAYAERLLTEKRVVPAEVTTATPLSDATRASLARALGAATGSQVILNERVDPSIVGGLIARVGSLVFDASVTRQLERLRQQLTTSN